MSSAPWHLPACSTARWRSATVRLSYTEPDYAKRLEPQAILDTLKGLRE